MTSELQAWLETNNDRLVEIGLASDVAPQVVHLVAVFVLSGLTDEQILDQFAELRSFLGPSVGSIRAMQAATAEIRALVCEAERIGVEMTT